MPHIPYLTEIPPASAELAAAIRQRRGGRLLNLDRMLLHSPPFAAGWNTFLREVRTGLALNGEWRELAICYIAVLTDADYELTQHAPEYLAQGGRAEVLVILQRGAHAIDDPGLTATEKNVLALTLAMTREVAVAPAVLERARAGVGSERELVELIGVIAAYNMVSRFLVATGVSLAGEDPASAGGN